MQPEILASAPRCGARTRSGEPCRSPAIHGRARCRMHGGKGSGAPRGNRNALKHGAFTGRMKAISHYIRMTGLVIKQASRSIWLSNCELRAAKIERRIAALGTPPTPIDLGIQPHAPGNLGKIGPQLAGAERASTAPQALQQGASSPLSPPPTPAPLPWRAGKRRIGGMRSQRKGKENLALPKASLICALHGLGPFAPHGFLA